MTKIFLVFLFWTCKATFLIGTKGLGSNFQPLVDHFSVLSRPHESFINVCHHYRLNLEIFDSNSADPNNIHRLRFDGCQPIFDLFVTNPARTKENIKSQVSTIMKNEIRALLHQFMLYDPDVADILVVAPRAYYEKSLSTLKWDVGYYTVLLSNVRRLSWLLGSTETGIASKDNSQLFNECINEFTNTIDQMVGIVNDDIKSDPKDDSESVLKLLQEIKSRFNQECQKLKSDEATDWSDFEPLIRFALEGRVNGFKNIREQYVELYQTAIQNNTEIFEFVNFDFLEKIFLAYKSPDLDDRLGPFASQISKEVLQQKMTAWNALIKNSKGFVGQSNKQRFDSERSFSPFFSYLLIKCKDQQAFDFFFEQFYQKANGLRNRLKDLKPANDPRLLERFVDLAFKIYPRTGNEFDFSLHASLMTNCFMLCFLASGVSSDQFKKSVTMENSKPFIFIYSHLDYLNPRTFSLFTDFSNYLASSKLLHLNENVMLGFIYWASKFFWDFLKYENFQTSLFTKLERFLSKNKHLSAKAPMNAHLQFLRLILLAEIPANEYCPSFARVDDSQFTAIAKLLETKEYSGLIKCLQTNAVENVKIEAQIAGPNPSDRLDISVNLNEVNIRGSKLILDIDLLNDKDFEVKPFFMSAASSVSSFIKSLKTSKALCRPDNFKLEDCFAPTAARLLI